MNQIIINSERISELVRKKSSFNRADFYIWVYILYQLQDILYPAGIIGQTLGILYILLSIFFGIKYVIFNSNNPLIINATSLLLWMYIIYGLIFLFTPKYNLNFEVNDYYYLQSALLSLLPILVFYSFLKKGYFSRGKMLLYLIPFFILFSLHYFRQYNTSLLENQELGNTQEEFTNNVGYQFLALVPIILLLKKNIVKYTALLLSFGFIISAFKRGAILIAFICFVYISLFEIFQNKNTKKKINSFLLIFILAAIGIFYIEDLYEQSEYFQQRIELTEEGNSSGRNELYEDIWDSYLNGNPVQLLLGRGANSTLIASKNYAHSDWLEIIHNNGILGVSLLIIFYISIFRAIKSLPLRERGEIREAFNVLLIICFVKSIFSMFIQNIELPIAMMIAYMAYLSLKDKINTNKYSN